MSYKSMISRNKDIKMFGQSFFRQDMDDPSELLINRFDGSHCRWRTDTIAVRSTIGIGKPDSTHFRTVLSKTEFYQRIRYPFVPGRIWFTGRRYGSNFINNFFFKGSW